MWNHKITLISKKVTGKDKLLQPISEDVEATLLCRKKRVTRSEFYQANQAGLKPSLVVEIRNFEYENQEFAVEDKNWNNVTQLQNLSVLDKLVIS